MTIAAALAVFSVDALVTGARARADAAAQSAGAPLVIDVDGPDALHSAQDVLSKVDPDGRRATPVARFTTPSGKVETMGVRPESFRRVALFGDATLTAKDLAVLDPAPSRTPIRLTGTKVSLAVTNILDPTSLTGDAKIPLGLQLSVQHGTTSSTVELGRLPARDVSATLTGTMPCSTGCTLLGVTLTQPFGVSTTGSFDLKDLTADKPVPLGPVERWGAVHTSDLQLAPAFSTDAELSIKVDANSTQELTLPSAYVPVRMPFLGTGVAATGSRAITFAGLGGLVRDGERAGTLERVPGGGADVALVDLDLLWHGNTSDDSARVSIWFAHDDRALLAKIARALAAKGVTVTDTQTLSDVRRGYDASVAAWSLQLGAGVGAASVLIALLVLLVLTVTGWRNRARDLAALWLAGVDRRTVRRLPGAAQLLPVTIGVVAGSLCGVVGARVSIPDIPIFPAPPEVDTLDLSTPVEVVALTAVACLLVLGLAAVLIGRVLARAARLDRLRETA